MRGAGTCNRVVASIRKDDSGPGRHCHCGEATGRKMPGRESMNSYGAQVGKMLQKPVTIMVRNRKGWCSISTKI